MRRQRYLCEELRQTVIGGGHPRALVEQPLEDERLLAQLHERIGVPCVARVRGRHLEDRVEGLRDVEDRERDEDAHAERIEHARGDLQVA